MTNLLTFLQKMEFILNKKENTGSILSFFNNFCKNPSFCELIPSVISEIRNL